MSAGIAPPAGSVAGSPHLPFAFVENRGQVESGVRFIGNGPDFKAWFFDRGVTLQQGAAVTRIRFEGPGNAEPPTASDPIGATANYLRGSNPSLWRTGLPMFGGIHYREVWPGVEVRFKAENTRAKAEYVVAPRARVGDIRLRFDGEVSIGRDGSLTVRGESGEFREEAPVLYQNRGSERVRVEGAFRETADGAVGFTASGYDPSLELVIDPYIIFTGYFGGSSQSTITSMEVNSSYNVVVAGWTVGSDLPAGAGYQKTDAGGIDAFVATFGVAGGGLLYCTYLGGSGDDRAFGLALDPQNNIYITGWTQSKNFPVVSAAQTKLSGPRDAFIAKLNAAGSSLVFSTYLGGSGADWGNGIAVDSSGSPIVIGNTTSTNLPTTVGVFQPHSGGGQDAFVAKLSPAGSSIVALTYYGGSGTENGAAIAVDSSGGIYIGGGTYSINLPTVRPFQAQSGGGQDGFVARLAANAASIVFSTYLGGAGGSPGAPEQVTTLALPRTGTVMTVAGITSSVNFPVTTAGIQKTFGGGQTDGFITKINTSTAAISQSSYLGGSGDDGINAITYDWDAWVYTTGFTTSADFPTVRGVQLTAGGGMDAFVTKMTPTSLIFSTYLGGSGADSGNAIAVDAMTSIVVAGTTSSGNFPYFGSVGTYTGSPLSSFLTKIVPNFTLAAVSTPTFVVDYWHNTGYNGAGAPATLTGATYGQAGDIPISGDWTGTGYKRIGIFRNGTWILDTNGNGVLDAADKTVSFGQAGDIPIVGDWNGTGQIKLGLYRQGTFILDLSGHLSGVATGLVDAVFPFGLASDLPVVADWNQSGTAKVGVFRNGQWLIDYNGDQVFNSSDKTYTFGQAGDIPVIGDWNNNGIQKIGVYRQGQWILDYDGFNAWLSNGAYAFYIGFGGAGYVPLVF